jgi:glucosamine-6-phosphate deaminase
MEGAGEAGGAGADDQDIGLKLFTLDGHSVLLILTEAYAFPIIRVLSVAGSRQQHIARLGDRVILRVFEDAGSLSSVAADHAAACMRRAIAEQGRARIVVATGNSQIGFLDWLTKAEGIAWGQVEMFHLDEYVGLPVTHPASFRKYLLERLINKVGITQYHLLDGTDDAGEVARRVGKAIRSAPVDVAFVGIGENGHLAFNDPPADFEAEEPYLVVRLDEACRRQQVGEGWFADISEVPREAISMSVRQILKAKEIICVVPDARKAQAVKMCFEGEIRPMAPASIMRTHGNATVYLDKDSGRLLSAAALTSFSGQRAEQR